MPSKTLPQFKADRVLKRPKQRLGTANIMLNTPRVGQDGDLKVSKNLNRFTLDVRYHDQWYPIRLRPKTYKYFQHSAFKYLIVDSLTSAGTYYHVPLGYNQTESTMSGTLALGDTMLVSENCEVTEIGFSQLSYTHTSGTVGIKLYRYPQESKGDPVTIGDWESVDKQEMTHVVTKGVYFGFRISRNLFKKGDLIAIEVAGPHTSFFNGLQIQILMKEFYDDLQ